MWGKDWETGVDEVPSGTQWGLQADRRPGFWSAAWRPQGQCWEVLGGEEGHSRQSLGP